MDGRVEDEHAEKGGEREEKKKKFLAAFFRLVRHLNIASRLLEEVPTLTVDE